MITSEQVQAIYRDNIHEFVVQRELNDNGNYTIVFNMPSYIAHCVRKYTESIADHQYFELEKEQRLKGITKQIHDKEIETYRNNGISRIELSAIEEGVCVWTRLDFQIVDTEQNKEEVLEILNIYREYLGVICFKDDPEKVDELMDGCKSIRDIVSDKMMPHTLHKKQGLDNFTDFLKKQKYAGLKMYKDLI
ncbi:MAG: hypothetical protein LBV04_02460 [Deferribacteraceae bacterium]|jgi:hypothetical protein|nr:hypothetical protein [Deferribacteraceae bacterium]